MNTSELKNTAQRTEEVRDIIDRMPYRTGRIVAILVTGLCLLLLFFGWLIEYPETVSGPVTVTARQAPVRLVANQAELVAKQNNLHTYLITVDLPNKLTTNYGASLDFRYEIKGIADIITKRRKLLERLFDNLKYIASKK